MKYYCSIAAIMKNEGAYLAEWLWYHKQLGVEHFYLYDNESTDNSVEIARSFDCTVIATPGQAAQPRAYEDALANTRRHTRWLGFLDIDEFLVIKQEHTLYGMLSKFEQYPGLAIHWRLYGSSGLRTRSDVPVTLRFTHAEAGVNPHIKCFVNPQRTTKYVTPHKFLHSTGLCVDENTVPIEPMDSTPLGGTTGQVQVNHYVTKSYAECIERRSQPIACSVNVRRNPEEFFLHHDRNEVEDLSAANFVRSRLSELNLVWGKIGNGIKA